MNGHRFDHIARIVGSRVSRRAGFGLLATGVVGVPSMSEAGKKKNKGKDKKITICHQGQTRKVKKKGWQKNYQGATQGECQVSSDVCAGCPNACFATAQAPNTPPPGYGCCPADKICQGAGGLPDQCCDTDEICEPRLATHPDGGGTVCCRRCGGNTFTGCCPPGFFCNAANSCEALGTARLPRTRRP